MRSYSFILFLLLFGVSPTHAQKQKVTASGFKAKLFWADEFNKKGHPDSRFWNYEVGFVRNQEKQYYTNNRLENVRIEKGKLIIETLKENYQDAGYTSGSINTLGKMSFDGDFRIEVRAILPQGNGIWPAIWMMGDNINTVHWPQCSELDIMEFVGHTPETVYATMHWADKLKNWEHASQGGNIKLKDLHTNYHVYGLERVGRNIQIFVDDKVILNFETPETAYPGSFTAPVYLLLNTALGGSWGGEIDDSKLPQKFVIDYVRAYHLIK